MTVKNKELAEIIKVLDDIIEDYKEKTEDKKRDYGTYEERTAKRLRVAFSELEPLVEEAISIIHMRRAETRGQKQRMTLKQKVMALLLKHLIGKSNRNMSFMLILFSWLTEVSVSYKTIERLYSDEMVAMVLHNLHILILKKKGIERVNGSGDGTGYSLTVKKHYATEAQKLKSKSNKGRIVKFIYSFALMDIDSRIYVAYGVSFKSEKDAFDSAIKMTEELNLEIESMRLDKYYSGRTYVNLLKQKFDDIKIFVLPKKNATLKGSWEWKRIMHDLIIDPVSFLEDYFQRNQSESGFSEDKKRTGWKLGQKRPDRINTANSLTILWHNMYWLNSEL